MKPLTNPKGFDVRKRSSNVPPKDFKAEVALIVQDLGIRLDTLLEQHEACLLKAACNGTHGDAHKDLVQMDSSTFCAESDMVTPFASMAKDVTFLPGCPEDPPRPPSAIKPWDSAGEVIQRERPQTPKAWEAASEVIQRRSDISTRSRTVELHQEIAARTIWSEEHTNAQQEAIKKYQGSFTLQAVDSLSRDSHARRTFRRRARKTPLHTVAKIKSNTSAKFKLTFGILHPVGPMRTLWNFLSLTLICLDALMVPLLAFEIGDSGGWEVFAWFCTLFWTADVMVSFRTGYIIGAKVELRPAKIAKQYAMSWLAFDLVVVVFEWFNRFFTLFVPAGVARTTRVIRGVRLVKLLRMTKMKGLLTEFSERLNSNFLSLLLQVFLLTTLLCSVCHFVTCLWYALGKDASDGWTHYDQYAVEQQPDQLGSLYWYLSSSRWVISQVNGRTDMDERRNMAERGFAVLAGVLLSVVARSVFVALITKSILQLSELYRKTEERRRNVNDYLRMHPVPATIERSVKAHAHVYKDVDAERQMEGIVLALLPKQLQKDLVFEARKPLLKKQPLFNVIIQAFQVAARHLCFDVVKQRHAVGQEMIFKSKDPCSRMLMMDRGSMMYGLSTYSTWIAPDRETESKEGPKVMDKQDSNPHVFQGAAAVIRVTHGMWLSEPAIWATWSNKGILITEDNCCMLEVDAMTFGPALQQHTDLFGLTVIYARQFLTFLRKEPLLSDILSFDVQNMDVSR